MRISGWLGVALTICALLAGFAWIRAYRATDTAERDQLNQDLEAVKQTASDSAVSVDKLQMENERLNSAIAALIQHTNELSPRNSAILEPEQQSLVQIPDTQPRTNESDGSNDTIGLSQATNDSVPLPYTQLQLEFYRCSNQMLQINIATEQWAQLHQGVIPGELSELRNYLAPLTLICPAKAPRSLVSSWEHFDLTEITYRIRPGAKGAEWEFKTPGPAPISMSYLTCPIHKIETSNRRMAGAIPLSQYFNPVLGR
jgi:hypothetical protein